MKVLENKKGASTALTVILGIMGLIVIGGLFMIAQQPQPTAVAKEYDGEFSDGGALNELSGSDLSVSSAYAEGDDNASMTLAISTDVNASANAINGQTYLLAYGFEINDDAEAMDVEGTIASAREDSDTETRAAYIVPDEEEKFIDKDDAIYTCKVDDTADFDCEVPALAEGEYAMVIETRFTTVSGSIEGNDLYTVTQELDTHGDIDTLDVDINA